MNKTISLMIAILLLLGCTACTQNPVRDDDYSLNITYSLGGDANQTRLSFDASIGDGKNKVENIDAFEVLINPEYLDLVLENGPYNSKHADDYMQIAGNVLFDNVGMTKEEIDAISLLQGFKIIDKDGNEFELLIPSDSEE